VSIAVDRHGVSHAATRSACQEGRTCTACERAIRKRQVHDLSFALHYCGKLDIVRVTRDEHGRGRYVKETIGDSMTIDHRSHASGSDDGTAIVGTVKGEILVGPVALRHRDDRRQDDMRDAVEGISR
jgi:hypothetical protein